MAKSEIIEYLPLANDGRNLLSCNALLKHSGIVAASIGAAAA